MSCSSCCIVAYAKRAQRSSHSSRLQARIALRMPWWSLRTGFHEVRQLAELQGDATAVHTLLRDSTYAANGALPPGAAPAKDPRQVRLPVSHLTYAFVLFTIAGLTRVWIKGLCIAFVSYHGCHLIKTTCMRWSRACSTLIWTAMLVMLVHFPAAFQAPFQQSGPGAVAQQAAWPENRVSCLVCGQKATSEAHALFCKAYWPVVSNHCWDAHVALCVTEQ